jgi:hypothetical protein
MVPHVEPCEQAKNEGDESIDRQAEVGNEQNPLEPCPSRASSCPDISSTETAMVVFVIETWNSGFATSEGIDSAPEFWKAERRLDIMLAIADASA